MFSSNWAHMILSHLKFGACISLLNTKYCLNLLSPYIKIKTWARWALRTQLKPAEPLKPDLSPLSPYNLLSPCTNTNLSPLSPYNLTWACWALITCWALVQILTQAYLALVPILTFTTDYIHDNLKLKPKEIHWACNMYTCKILKKTC